MREKKQILIVEDEPVVATDIKISLKSAGYNILGTANSGKDALFLIKEKTPDLILMDIKLNGKMSGIETAKRIMAIADIPIVYLTAHTDDKTVEKAKTTNPFGFLIKPFGDIELQTTIEMALNKFKMEKKLKDSETLLSTTFRSLGDGVIITNADLLITYINPYAVMMTGRSPDMAIGASLDEIFHLKDEITGEQLTNIAVNVLKEGELTELINQVVLVNSDEKELPVDTSIAPIIKENNEINGVVLVFHDTLDRKLTEVALRESETRYRSLFEESNDAIYIITRKGNFVIANESMQKMFGFNDEEIIDFNLMEFFLDLDSWQNFKKLIEENGNIRDFQTRMKTKNGSILDCLITSSARQNEHGQLLGFQGIIRDMTEPIRSEKALRKSERRYRMLAENIIDIIWTMDHDLNFTYVTPSITSILGFTVEEFLQLDLKTLCSSESYPGAVKYFSDLLNMQDDKGINENDLEIQWVKNSGEIVWVNVSSTIFRNNENESEGIIGIAHDITKRKLAESEKDAMHEQFLQAQKMEAIGILAGGVAHDFNNLLTVIQGSTDLIILRIEENDPIYSDLYEINKASKRAAELTSQLLLFSRKKPMCCKTVNVNLIVEELLKMLHRLIGEDVSISTFLDETIWNISADMSNIEQVIMNLVVNARDAMPVGGQVTIKSENIIFTKQDLPNHPEARPGRFICLSFTDNGMGMDEMTLQRIFEPFYSTKGTGKGTGLGLSVVYGIVSQHLGWIDVISQKGKGTIFKLYFPAIEKETTDESIKTITPASLQGSGETVLLVEDEEGVRQFVTKALEEHGYKVISASNSTDAMNLFKDKKYSFSILVSDVVLPDFNGIELVEKLHEIQPNLLVLLCSGYTDQKSQWNVIQEKGYPYLQKPYSIKKLLRTVKQILLQ